MLRHRDAVLDAVRRPDHREDDPAPGRERFYRRDLEPRRWLRVIVDFSESPPVVVTAFVRPRPERQGPMNITIAGTTFDDHEYDARGDVLYLTMGRPREPARTIATPEEHAVDYDEDGAVIGMVLVNVRFPLERDGAVTITIPPDRLEAAQIEPALLVA